MTLNTDHGTKSVQDIADLYQQRRLNLAPAFQRGSVWSDADRRLLVNSLFDGIPLPSIYLYRQIGPGGKPVYDVIDGKQRIESMLAFMTQGPIHKKAEPLYVSRELDAVEGRWLWKDLNKEVKHAYLTVTVPIIEVEGDLGEIIDLFVRINATGKKLTTQERRHAHYFNSPLLKGAQKAAESLTPTLLKSKVISRSQQQRMKHVELVTELLLSINAGMPINKKSKIDEVLRGKGLVDVGEVADAVKALRQAVGLVHHLLPDLRTTRFHRLADFYTLVLLLHRLRSEGLSVTTHNSARNRLAGELLRSFGTGVDVVGDKLSRGASISKSEEPFRDYLMTVKEGTDSKAQRDKREKLLRGVLAGVFEPLDPNRLFSETQRRILWNASSKKSCGECLQPIKWEDLAIDHVAPHIKGGSTKLSNAVLTHKKCNAAAGAK